MIEPTPPVAILMGSQSDWATLRHAADTLDSLGIAHDDRIISAHRTPDRLITFCKGARRAGYKIIIAGAGGAAHLPGMCAALTPLPVLGVPVGTLAIGRSGAINAALLAAAVLALFSDEVASRLDGWRMAQSAAVDERPSDDE